MFVLAYLSVFQLLHGYGEAIGAISGQDAAGNCQTQTLYFLSLLPYPDPNPALQPSWDEGPSVFLAEQLAVEHINNRSDILTGYQIELIQGDGGCDIGNKALVSSLEYVVYHEEQIVGIVGPGCSNSAIAAASLTRQKEIALINFHLASSNLLQDRTEYPYSYGIRGSSEALFSLIALMKHNNWTRVATLYDESRSFYYLFQTSLQEILRKEPNHHIVLSSAVYDTHIPLEAIEQAGIRIILLLLGPELLSKVGCLAYHRGFVFPTYQMMSPLEQLLNDTTFMYHGTRYHCNRDDLLKVGQGNVFFTYRVIPLNKSQMTETGFTYEQFSSLYEERVMKYNKIAGVPIEQSFWASAFYDAVWALALALNSSIDPLHTQLNHSLSNYRYGQPDVTKIIRQQVEGLDFNGISGNIQFDNQTGYVHRIVDISLYSQNRSVIPVGYFSNNELHITADVQFIPDSFEEETEEFPLVQLLLTIIFLVFTFVESVLLVATHIVTIVHRKSGSVKASSSKLNHLAYTGCYLLLVTVTFSIVFISLPTTSVNCALQHVAAFTFIGATLVLGVVLVKTWRLYRILVHFRNPGKFLSDRSLITLVLLLAGVELLLNLIWIGVDPYRVETDSNGKKQCEAKYEIVWTGVPFGYQGLITTIAVWYAVLCHKTPTPMKEFKTTNVIFLAYSNTLIHVIGLSIFFVLFTFNQTQANTIAFAVFCLSYQLIILSYLVVLFIPPIWPIVKQRCIYCHP